MHYLRYLAPILDMSGYAYAARGNIIAADHVGIAVKAADRSRSLNLRNKGIDQPILDMYSRLSAIYVPDDCPTVQHTVADQFFVNKKTKRSIGYTIFEMTRIPFSWVDPCNQMDEIWTGSEYSQNAFQNSGLHVPIHVLPHAIDVDAFANATPWKIENRRKFAFMANFDFTERKAWRDLLRAYWNAFGPKDDVCLILKVFFGDFSDASRADILRRILRYKTELKMDDCAPILVYGHDVANSDMPGLYKAADCYVGTSREGFGLSYSEAMAAGLACIGPEIGGTRQFMTPENSFLVKYTGDEPLSKEMIAMNPSFDGLEWATHSREHLSETMRTVWAHNEERLARAKLGQDFVRRELSYANIGKKILNLLA